VVEYFINFPKLLITTEIYLRGLDSTRKIARWVLLAVLAVSAVFAWKVASVRFDYNFEKFFPEGDEETQFFEAHRRLFETDNDFIFIALKRKEGVFDKEFLLRVDQFTDTLLQDTAILEVQGLTNMVDYVKSNFLPLPFKREYIHVSDPEKYASDSALIFSRPDLAGFFITDKADALLVHLKHRPFMQKKECDALLDRIDQHLEHFKFDEFSYAGRAVGMRYYIGQMQFETGFFILLSFVLVIVFLAFTFKSLWGVVIPLAVVTMSMVWIVGFMSMMDQPINLVLTVLPSIIFVVAMSDVIHLVAKYFDELRSGKDRINAVKTAYLEVGVATLMTSVTTAIGFLTLLTINMEPIWDFGIYTATGVMLSFGLAYTLLPPLLILTKPPKIAFRRSDETIWYKFLHRAFLVLIRRRAWVLGGFGFMLLVSIGGTLLVKADYFLLEDISPESSLRQDYDYFDKEMMGCRPFELAVNVKKPHVKITDYEVLLEMDKIETYLVNEYGLKRTFSVVTALKMTNRSEHGGQQEYYKLPDKADAIWFLDLIREYDRKNRLRLVVDSTEKTGRISSTLGDIGRYEIERRNEAFRKFLHTNIDNDLIDVRLTGTAHLLDKNMTVLSRNLMWGLLSAVGVIGLLMGFLYRSVRIMWIALIPNIIPMLMLSAIMGFAGIQLTVATAIIFTISFGIAVDDTIHFLSRFRLERKRGMAPMLAMRRTYLSTGRAMVLTTVILCSGFLLLMLSDFLGTFYIGLLISCTLFFALLADLFLLPVLLMYFYKAK